MANERRTGAPASARRLGEVLAVMDAPERVKIAVDAECPGARARLIYIRCRLDDGATRDRVQVEVTADYFRRLDGRLVEHCAERRAYVETDDSFAVVLCARRLAVQVRQVAYGSEPETQV